MLVVAGRSPRAGEPSIREGRGYDRAVGALGDLLELIHDAAVHARPATLTLVEWSHATRASEAFARYIAERHGTGYGVSQVVATRAGTPVETSWSTTLSLERADRFREESAGRQAGQRYLVRDGERWLSWDASWGTVSSEVEQEGGAPSSTYAFLLDPVGVVGELLLEPQGTGDLAGRPAVLARGVPRDEPEHVGATLMRLGAGADEIELAFDAERGALLRAEARLDGEPFRRFEVTQIGFAPIPAETFTVEAPADTPPAGHWPRPMPLPLHEVAAASPFTVLVPERVPDGWRLTSMLMEGRDEPPLAARAYLTYLSPEGAYGVTLQQSAAGGETDDEWREWRRDGELEVADAGAHVEPRHHVRIERHGTLVELSGGDPDLLAELAGVLVPAPTEPPRLS